MTTLLLNAMPSAEGLSFWLSAAGNVALIITVIVLLARKKEERIISPQPLEVSGEVTANLKSRIMSPEVCETRHLALNQRVDSHEKQIGEIWFTLRKEDAAIRAALEAAVRDFDQTVNETKGTLRSLESTNALILKRLLRA
jgi:hypothetical protein